LSVIAIYRQLTQASLFQGRVAVPTRSHRQVATQATRAGFRQPITANRYLVIAKISQEE